MTMRVPPASMLRTGHRSPRQPVWQCDRCGIEVKKKSLKRKRLDGLRLCGSCQGDNYYIRRAGA